MKEIKVFKSSIHKDKRGYLWTSWFENKNKLKFKHDKFSISKKNTLRGLHSDVKTWKLVSCVFGKVFFVVVNNDQSSKSYLKKKTFILDHSKNDMAKLHY